MSVRFLTARNLQAHPLVLDQSISIRSLKTPMSFHYLVAYPQAYFAKKETKSTQKQAKEKEKEGVRQEFEGKELSDIKSQFSQ